MNTVLKNYHLGAPLFALALLVAAPSPASAAGPDTLLARSGRIVLEVDADGRLLVNGSPVRGDADGRYVLRLDTDEDDGTMELRTSAGWAPGRFAFGMAAAPGAWGFRFHESDPFDDDDFEVFVGPGAQWRGRLEKELAPLLEGRRAPHVLMLDRLRENAEVAELEHEARQLAREARRADGAERERLEGELRAKLEAIFDEKMKVRRERVERLERDLREARDAVDARQRARAEMIDRRLRELLGEEDALEW